MAKMFSPMQTGELEEVWFPHGMTIGSAKVILDVLSKMFANAPVDNQGVTAAL